MQPEYKDVVNFKDGLNSDIIKVLEFNFKKAKHQTKEFAEEFRGRNLLDSCSNVWHYVKKNIPYVADSNEEQKIVLPARLIERAKNGVGADCKSFSLFCASIISNLYPDADVNFRYTTYRGGNIPTHVYCVVKTNRGEIICDAVWNKFNTEKKYTFKKDSSMKIATLSGINDNDNKEKTLVDVYTFNFFKHNLDAMKNYKVGTPDYEHYAANIRYGKEMMNKNPIPINGKLKKFLKSITTGAKNTINKTVTTLKNTASSIVPPRGVDKKDYLEHIATITTLAVPRNAFLILLKFNYRDFCNRILQNFDSVSRRWYQLGGDKNALKNQCESHKNKKALFGKPRGLKGFGVYGIGCYNCGGNCGVGCVDGASTTLCAIAANVAVALPIITAVVALLPKRKEDELGDIAEKNITEGTPEPDGSQPTPEETDETKVFGINTKTLLIGGGVLTALFIVPKFLKSK